MSQQSGHALSADSYLNVVLHFLYCFTKTCGGKASRKTRREAGKAHTNKKSWLTDALALATAPFVEHSQERTQQTYPFLPQSTRNHMLDTLFLHESC